MKIDWLITDVTNSDPPTELNVLFGVDFGWACFWPIHRAERAILGVVVVGRVFGQSRSFLRSRCYFEG